MKDEDVQYKYYIETYSLPCCSQAHQLVSKLVSDGCSLSDAAWSAYAAYKIHSYKHLNILVILLFTCKVASGSLRGCLLIFSFVQSVIKHGWNYMYSQVISTNRYNYYSAVPLFTGESIPAYFMSLSLVVFESINYLLFIYSVFIYDVANFNCNSCYS